MVVSDCNISSGQLVISMALPMASRNCAEHTIYHSANETLYTATATRRRSTLISSLDVNRHRQMRITRRSSVFGTNGDKLTSLRLSSHQSATSPFLALPAEIRNQVYTSLFLDDPPRIRPEYEIPSILRTCRQIYYEALGLYYTSTPFRCLDEDSAVSWLSTIPPKYLDMIPEVRYDTRWIIFVTPYIPVPGAECWLFQNLLRKLGDRGQCDVQTLLTSPSGHDDAKKNSGTGRLRISYYRKGDPGSGVVWTDKPGLIEIVNASR